MNAAHTCGNDPCSVMEINVRQARPGFHTVGQPVRLQHRTRHESGSDTGRDDTGRDVSQAPTQDETTQDET